MADESGSSNGSSKKGDKGKGKSGGGKPRLTVVPAIGAPAPGWRFVPGSHVDLGRAMLQQLESRENGVALRAICDEGSLWSYDSDRGIWNRVDDVIAGKIIQTFDGTLVKRGADAESYELKLKEVDIRGALACAKRDVAAPGFFAGAPPSLVFRDVTVTVSKKGGIEKREHASSFAARYAYEFDYTDKKPTAFLAALEGMFRPDSKEDREAKIRLLCEFVGVALLGAAPKLQRWILLKGLGDDGKSTTIDMLRGAMPSGSTCSIRPQDLEDEYARADLAGKLLNTVTEIKNRDVLEAETLKAVTVGDEMRGRRIREAPITFKPRAAHLLAANSYPKFSDSSHGFWRRPIVIVFNRCFTGDPERVVGLGEEILEASRPEIVCYLVRAGAAALARGKFIEPPSHADAIKEWRGETDAVFEFIGERLVVADKLKTASVANGWSTPSDLYAEFLLWATKTGHREMSSTAFGRRLTELGHTEVRTSDARLRPLSKREKEKK